MSDHQETPPPLAWHARDKMEHATANGVTFRVRNSHPSYGEDRATLEILTAGGWVEVRGYTYKSGGYSYPLGGSYFGGSLSAEDKAKIFDMLCTYAEFLASIGFAGVADKVLAEAAAKRS